ncbi:hypothetical protein B0H11DRAFT_1900339 [Mycena galericulata]|nr:hypothetical protein B0H11DRAFT_1900339 [Mycena galericulata]
MFCADGMFRPARFWPRARENSNFRARARKTLVIPPREINLMSKGSVIKSDTSKSVCKDPMGLRAHLRPSELHFELVFHSIKGAESFIPPQDRMSDRSQSGIARVAGLKSPQSTLNLTQACLESGLGRRCKPGLGSDLVMSLTQGKTNVQLAATPDVALGIHIGFPDQPLSLHVTVKSMHSFTTYPLLIKLISRGGITKVLRARARKFEFSRARGQNRAGRNMPSAQNMLRGSNCQIRARDTKKGKFAGRGQKFAGRE